VDNALGFALVTVVNIQIAMENGLSLLMTVEERRIADTQSCQI